MIIYIIFILMIISIDPRSAQWISEWKNVTFSLWTNWDDHKQIQGFLVVKATLINW
jgi:hypothetical protein